MAREATLPPEDPGGSGGSTSFPPIAIILEPITGAVGETFIFDGQASHWYPFWNQPGNTYYTTYYNQTLFQWVFSAGSPFGDRAGFGAGGALWSEVASAAWTGTVTLTVTDVLGVQNSIQATVTVNPGGGNPPNPVLYGPEQCLNNIPWFWSARDTEDVGAVGLDNIFFRWEWPDGTSTPSGPIGDPSGWGQGWDYWHVKKKFASGYTGTGTITLRASNAAPPGNVYNSVTQSLEVRERNILNQHSGPTQWKMYQNANDDPIGGGQDNPKFNFDSGFWEGSWRDFGISSSYSSGDKVGAVNGWERPSPLPSSYDTITLTPTPFGGARDVNHEGALAHNVNVDRQIANQGEGKAVEVEFDISLDGPQESSYTDPWWGDGHLHPSGQGGTRGDGGGHMIMVQSTPQAARPLEEDFNCWSSDPTPILGKGATTVRPECVYWAAGAGPTFVTYFKNKGNGDCCYILPGGVPNIHDPTQNNPRNIQNLRDTTPGPWLFGTVTGPVVPGHSGLELNGGDGKWLRIQIRVELLPGRIIRETVTPIALHPAGNTTGTGIPYNIAPNQRDLLLPTVNGWGVYWFPLHILRLGNYDIEDNPIEYNYSPHIPHPWEPAGSLSSTTTRSQGGLNYHVHFRNMVIKPTYFSVPYGCSEQPYSVQPF